MTITAPPANIIVKMPNWLGDLVMATPVLEDLRAHFPDAQITAMCSSAIAPLLKEDPHITDLYSYQRPNGWVHRSQHWEIIQDLRRGMYDLGILLTNSFSSAWWFWRGHVKNRMGYPGNCRSLLLSEVVSPAPNRAQQHLVVTYKQLLAPLGIPLSNSVPRLYLTPGEQMAAKEKLTQIVPLELHKTLLLGVNPGAAYGSAKCWPPDRFVALSKKILENPWICMLYFGDESGTPLVEDICRQIPSERVINLAGKTTLRELLALTEQCAAFLSNDSGPMHIAAALDVPVVALFGSTNELVTGPYRSGTVLHKHVACSPCYKRVCPIDFRCMTGITVDEVHAALIKILG